MKMASRYSEVNLCLLTVFGRTLFEEIPQLPIVSTFVCWPSDPRYSNNPARKQIVQAPQTRSPSEMTHPSPRVCGERNSSTNLPGLLNKIAPVPRYFNFFLSFLFVICKENINSFQLVEYEYCTVFICLSIAMFFPNQFQARRFFGLAISDRQVLWVERASCYWLSKFNW